MAASGGGRARIHGAVFTMAVVALAGIAGWRLLHLYAGPWEPYAGPAREFLSAAAERDSAGLARLGVSAEVADRALAVSGLDPARFVIRGRLGVLAGQRGGDTTRLTYHATPCPLVLTFAGPARRARVVNFASCPAE